MAKRRLPPISTGHSPILGAIELTKEEIKELNEKGSVEVELEVEGKTIKKTIHPSNVRGGRVQYYVRSTGEVAFRNYPSDYGRSATHRASKGKPFAGD
ncbi:MAG: hypothetical protein QXJ17_04400 [Nitrososphaeria archaeon]